MSQQAKNSPAHMKPYLMQLEEALKNELKFRGSAQAQTSSELSITSGMRDGSAHVLRCLKVWYDLPSDVFFNAVSSIDRFLSKMKAQPKHLSCIAVSAFHLACRQHHDLLKFSKKYTGNCPVPDPQDLVNISQSRCSPSDLLRMETILANKLELNSEIENLPQCQPVTSLTLLRIMFNVAKVASLRLDMPELLPDVLPEHLLHQLEIISCDSVVLQFRPSEVALALLAAEFQRMIAKQVNGNNYGNALLGFISELQKYSHISGGKFVQCLEIVVGQLEKYHGEATVTHRQRLVWKLSNRTLRHLRPTDKLRATLPTISEISNPKSRLRSNSECSDESMESSSESEFERELMEEETTAGSTLILSF